MIEILKAGLYTTIQDKGRTGYRALGVPVSGAMDTVSAAMANKLLNNDTEAAVLEFTMMGPKLQFKVPTVISICGAAFQPKINGKSIDLNKAISVAKKDILTLGHPEFGSYGYLAVSGGFEAQEVLGSRSFYKNITKNSNLEKGAILKLQNPSSEKILRNASFAIDSSHFSDNTIEVFPGPELHLLSKKFQKEILASTLKIGSQSNRMAYVMEGLEAFSAKEIITAPVQPGTVQLTPSGKCVVLMRDAQTTGGYARIFQLTNHAICKLAQKRAGDKVQVKVKKYYNDN